MLDLDYELLAVIPVVPEPVWTESLSEWAREKNLKIMKFRDLDSLPTGYYDLGVSIFFNEIFKQKQIDKFTKLINLHNAPLPKYRGVKPINWAMKNSESSHGVTIHEITTEIDAGAIYSQVIFPIWPLTDNLFQTFERAMSFGRLLIAETLPRIWEIEPFIQDSKLATYYSKSDEAKLGEWKSW